MKAKNKIEVLAPAGSVDRMKAAFAGGADACYIGGTKFGARAFADNPSEKELIEAIYYAHLHNKKLFLTVNTLLKERELKDSLYHYILPYYKAGIDAAIVQDFGVMKFLSEHFPDLPLHASTQMSLCDVSILEAFKNYPIERLVLARELSISEISNFKMSGLEIECFVQGALCVCYSGQCSMSYFNGGRSGNRGSCAGPCRVDYNLYGADSTSKPKSGKKLEGNPYLLSPKDICALDSIPEMSEAGIYSFKIEGRMKKPEYAAFTSYLYRKWSDIYLEMGKEYFHSKTAKKEREKDILDLSDLYNRGGFTKGYYFQHNGKDMMSDIRPNHNGVLIGKIKKVGTSKKKNVMQIETFKELNPQDVLEVRDRKTFLPMYEFTLKEGFPVKEVFQANFTMGLGIREGMEVYRTKNDKLLTHISEDIIENSPKRSIKACLTAKIGENLRLTLSTEGMEATLEGGEVLQAKKQPISRERMEQALMKLGDTEFCLEEEIVIRMDKNVFFPISSLNELRREACRVLYEKIIASFKREKESPPSLGEGVVAEKKRVPKTMIMVSQTLQLDYFLQNARKYSTSVELSINTDLFPRGFIHKAVLEAKKLGYSLFLRLPEIFRRDISEIYKNYFLSQKGQEVLSRLTGFLVRNPEELVFVKGILTVFPNLEIIADTNLHVFNSYSAEVLYEMGASSYTMSLSHSLKEAGEAKQGIRVPIRMDMKVYGREEVMVTTQCQWKNKLKCVKELKTGEERLPDILFLENKKSKTNGKSIKYPVAKNCEICNNYIFTEQPIHLFSKKEEIETLNPYRIRMDFTFEHFEEISEVMKFAKLGE